MISLSAAILVATCTATFGLHSSSSTTISYSYFDFGSALRSRTARSAELRPPIPFTDQPPVSGTVKPTFTLFFASAAPDATPRTSAAISAANFGVVLISPPSPIIEFGRFLVGAIVARHAHHGKGCPARTTAFLAQLGSQRHVSARNSPVKTGCRTSAATRK